MVAASLFMDLTRPPRLMETTPSWLGVCRSSGALPPLLGGVNGNAGGVGSEAAGLRARRLFQANVMTFTLSSAGLTCLVIKSHPPVSLDLERVNRSSSPVTNITG